jgi:hypothetical protein
LVASVMIPRFVGLVTSEYVEIGLGGELDGRYE